VNKRWSIGAAFGVLVSFIICTASAAAQTGRGQRYSITEVGGIGTTGSIGFAMNDQGHVTGNSFNGQGIHAFLWDGKLAIDLGDFGYGTLTAKVVDSTIRTKLSGRGRSQTRLSTHSIGQTAR